MVSPAAKLCGFLLLLAVILAVAFAVGAHLGPLSTNHGQTGHGQPMNMGAPGPR
jgi:hypothetical protein